MKKIIKQIELSKKLAGKVLGSLSEEQEQALNDWEKNAHNKKIESDILNSETFEAWNKQMDKINTSDEWGRFIDTIQKTNQKGKIVRMRVFKVIASVAAVLVIGFASYFAYQIADFDKEYQTVAEADITPGSSSAQLILADGSVVNLDTSKEGIIPDGSFFVENEHGVLVYDSVKETKNLKPVVNTVIIPRGGEYQLVLPDGTKVWLNSDTELTYTVPFSGNERKVNLKGEAYFDVTPNKLKPFIVTTVDQNVEVLGTEFNISAYSEDLNVVTTLVEGKVKVEHTGNGQNRVEDFLLPNEQLVLNKETQAVLKQNVDTYSYTSWKDGRFTFSNEPLESFFAKLARWYNVEVVITDESVKHINFTGDLPRYKNMTDILRIVEAEMSVHIEIKNNNIIYISR